MKVISKEQFLKDKEFYIGEIFEGRVFIYPTDTIYGIGCNALISESVRKIRELKKRDEKPFSVIAPGKDWIKKNCFIYENVEKWLGKLPGAYTLILEMRNWEAIAKEVNSGMDSLGVRIPAHWFSEVVVEAGVPFVTTSVNLSGEMSMSSVSNVNERIKKGVDYIIDEGEKKGRASKIVRLIGNKEEIIER